MDGPRACGGLCGLFGEARRFVVFHDTTVLVGADLDLGAHVQLFELVRVEPSHGVRWKSLDDEGQLRLERLVRRHLLVSGVVGCTAVPEHVAIDGIGRVSILAGRQD